MDLPDKGLDCSVEPDMLLTIEIPSRVDFVALVRMVVAAAANSVDALSGDRLDDLRLVVSEATTNAIEANVDAVCAPGLAEIDEYESFCGSVKVACEVSGDCVTLEVADAGEGMRETSPLPEITHPDRLFIEGGFGVPLIEHLSNMVDFSAVEAGTTVTIKMTQ